MFGDYWLAGRAKYGYLLVDVDVKRWYDNDARDIGYELR